MPHDAYGYAHVNGPSYTCPNSELNYDYTTDFNQDIVLSITNGLIFNEVTQTWVTLWSFSVGEINLNFPFSEIAQKKFKVKWNNLAIGATGNIHVNACSGPFCANGNRGVTFGASPGNPVISGSDWILNCINELQNYSAINIPENWNLVTWTFSGHIQSVNGTLTPKTVQATSTTWNGLETLTGKFNFVTGGNTCATQNVVKSIWLGKPAVLNQKVDGVWYYPTFPICPGSHKAEVTWLGLVANTSWSVSPGVSYSANNDYCNFNFPNGPSSISISVNGSNTCGTGSNTTFNLTKKSFGCSSFLTILTPNPASSDFILTTALTNESDGIQYEVVADGVELFDDQNATVISMTPNGTTTNFDTKYMRNGTYYLHVKFGGENFVKRVIIKK